MPQEGLHRPYWSTDDVQHRRVAVSQKMPVDATEPGFVRHRLEVLAQMLTVSLNLLQEPGSVRVLWGWWREDDPARRS